VKNDDLALDRVGVDRAAVLALVERMNVAHLQVPLLDVRPHDAEPRVVDDASFLVRQRNGMMVQPRHLPANTADPPINQRATVRMIRTLFLTVK